MEHKLESYVILRTRVINWRCTCGTTGTATMGYGYPDQAKQQRELVKIAKQRVYQHGRRAAAKTA